MISNFYCNYCITRLIKYIKTVKENLSLDSIINCLRPFNLKDVDMRYKEVIDFIKIIIE